MTKRGSKPPAGKKTPAAATKDSGKGAMAAMRPGVPDKKGGKTRGKG